MLLSNSLDLNSAVSCLLSTDIDECHSSPCHNGGDCVNEEAQYHCQCKAGYTGYNCEIGNALFLSNAIIYKICYYAYLIIQP